MTLEQGRTGAGWKHTPPEHTPRLRMKPKAPTTGSVDGAWWPRSNDLETELPDLLAVLYLRLGAIRRVIYNLDEWATVRTQKFAIGERTVQLDGYPRKPINTARVIHVIGVNRNNIMLLIVPPHTDPDQAHDTLMAAAVPNDTSTITKLLTASAQSR